MLLLSVVELCGSVAALLPQLNFLFINIPNHPSPHLFTRGVHALTLHFLSLSVVACAASVLSTVPTLGANYSRLNPPKSLYYNLIKSEMTRRGGAHDKTHRAVPSR